MEIGKPDKSDETLIMIDSGSFAHVCPLGFAKQFPLIPVKEKFLALAADGRPITNFGERHVEFILRSGQRVRARFRVMKVRRPILSVARLKDNGADTHFSHDGIYIEKENVRNDLVERGNLFFLPVRLADGPASMSAVSAVSGTDKPWMLFEWACEGDSKLAQWFLDRGHAAVRLHPPQ